MYEPLMHMRHQKQFQLFYIALQQYKISQFFVFTINFILKNNKMEITPKNILTINFGDIEVQSNMEGA